MRYPFDGYSLIRKTLSGVQMTNINLKKVSSAALCVALCLFLPFITAGMQQLGNMLLPMHLPVLICGAVCGPVFGGIVGAVSPLLRSLIFGMPVLFPTAVAMSLELSAMGTVMGLLSRIFPKKIAFSYIALLSAQLCGRIIGGAARLVLSLLSNTEIFGFSEFVAVYFTATLPGALIQLLLIPPVIYALRRSRLDFN